jgi:hypothetical protein
MARKRNHVRETGDATSTGRPGNELSYKVYMTESLTHSHAICGAVGDNVTGCAEACYMIMKKIVCLCQIAWNNLTL